MVSPSRRASGSKVAPWTRVELTTTKKTIANSSSPLRMPATTGKVASQIGVAPRSPAQPSSSRSRMRKGESAVAAKVASGRATRISTAESASPLTATSPRALGKTSSPSRMKSEICEIQPSPSWKVVSVRLAGIGAVPSASAVR